MSRINSFCTGRNVKAYIVGGMVRDALLDRPTADIDIAVAGDALPIASQMADFFTGKYVLLDEANKVGRVVLTGPDEGQWHIDVSAIVSGINADLARRDFTINAMGIELDRFVKSPDDAPLLDPFNGRLDLEHRIIRATGDTVFESDAARLLRAVRLSAELGFTIAPETETLIRRSPQLLSGVAGERVREELLRILSAPKSGYSVRYLANLGLLTAIIPELSSARGVEQPLEHVWDVFDHSIETVKAVDFMLRRESLEYASAEVLACVPWSEKLQAHFESEAGEGCTRASLLKMTALLHDIAKPETKTIEESGRVRFLGHTDKGAEKAAVILERLRFSAREIKLAATMVSNHLRPVQMGHDAMPTDRAIYRYFRDTGDAGIDILFLSLADHLAARGASLDMQGWKEHCRVTEYVLDRRFREESIVTPPKLIDGHDLMNIFHLNPGPEIGELLEEVREAQASGEINTREEALSYVRNKVLYKRM